MSLSRREFSQQALTSLATFALLDTLFQRDAFAAAVKPITVRWLNDINDLGFSVKEGKLPQEEWQKKVEELYSQVRLEELLTLVDFEKLTQDLKIPDHGARSLRFGFQEIEGVPTKLAFGKQIFALKKNCSVVPHGHNNMCTAFLILQGQFHGRHYDRLEDAEDHLIIRPTIDRQFAAGEFSSVSDHKDNIHWFKAGSEPAFIFNIHVLGVPNEFQRRTGRVYLDPQGEPLGDGRLKARRIGHNEAHELYG